MRRIKFIRKLQLHLDQLDRKDDIKIFEPLIQKLPTKNLDEEVLKSEINKFCQIEHGFSLEESAAFYSKIMSTKHTKSYGINSNIGLFKKKGFKTSSTKPFQGGSPGLGKNK